VEGGPFQILPLGVGTSNVIAMIEGRLVIRVMHWGLIPHWLKEERMNFSTLNARSEAVDQSRLYAPYFRNSRCLVPVDAFYKWRKVVKVGKEAGEKIPFCIRMKDERTFLLAGVYSLWKDEEEIEHPTFSIITTGPNELVAEIHDRMPVILPKEHWRDWLQTDKKDTSALKQMLLPFPAKEMKAYPVSRFVSSSKNEGMKCMEPVRE
jgi:putative SOS response-associated peptidase YedK